MSARRGGERGLSIIEAIVITTITALLALLILPMLPRAASGSLSVAERGIDALDAMRAEREFRTLVRSVVQRDVEGQAQIVLSGDASQVTMRANLPALTACARAGAPMVRLAVRDNALVCESGNQRRLLLRWPREHGGALSYSADGRSWLSGWSSAEAAPYVRFELRQRSRVRASWVERVSGDPA